jgi:hypothetical protein
MRNNKVFVLVFAIILCCHKSYGNDSLSIKIDMKKLVRKRQDCDVSVYLRNLSTKNLLIPKYLYLGYEDDPYCNFVFTLERFVNNHFVKVLPSSDCDIVFIEDNIDTLKVKSVKEFNFNLHSIYKLKKGNYRVKAIYKVSGLRKQYIESNWIKFEVDVNQVVYDITN